MGSKIRLWYKKHLILYFIYMFTRQRELILLVLSKFVIMNIRQEKIASLIQKELGQYFQKEARTLCMGAMVSVTVIRLSPDLSIAKVYLSIFGAKNIEEVFEKIMNSSATIRFEIGKIVTHQLRKTPDFHFYLDDSFDYSKKIDDLLKE